MPRIVRMMRIMDRPASHRLTIALVPVLLLSAACAEADPADGRDDPARLECVTDGYVQEGSVMPSRSYDTVMEAAEATAFSMGADGHPIPDDAELVALDDEPGHQVAVRVDGRTVLILRIEGEPGNWSVGSYSQC